MGLLKLLWYCDALATAVSARKASPVDFLPLTVDYRENLPLLEDSQWIFQTRSCSSNEEI